jgi:hypothetical protein
MTGRRLGLSPSLGPERPGFVQTLRSSCIRVTGGCGRLAHRVVRWCCGAVRAARTVACWSGPGGGPCPRIEGAVDGGLGDSGEVEVVVAGVGSQPGEGLVQLNACAF